MSNEEMIVLRTSKDYPDGMDGVDVKYSRTYTGVQALRTALMGLRTRPNSSFRLLLRDYDEERWLSEEKTLAEEGVEDQMFIFVLPYNPTLIHPADIRTEELVEEIPQQDEIRPPVFDVDLTRFYVSRSDYVMGKGLGSGVFAKVHEAKHIRTGEIVAIKEITINPDNPDQVKLYQREVQMLSTLHHPAMLSLLGCTQPEINKPAWIITPKMKYAVDQCIVLERGKESPPEWTSTRKHIVLLGVAAGMAFMHENCAIYRDIKPNNILLNDAFEPLIADFGLSKFIDTANSLQQSIHLGGAQYMAPEIHNGDEYDHTVDVYGFGMTMFSILTGIEPFGNIKAGVAIGRKVCNGDRPTIPGNLNDVYRQLIESCWNHNPMKRPYFKDVMFQLGTKDCLKGLDVDAVMQYQTRVCPPDLIPKLDPEFIRQARQAIGKFVPLEPIAELRRLADSGDARSQVQFGDKLEKGDNITKNPVEAVRYYRLAADQEDEDGIVALGRCFYYGIGVRSDTAAAVGLFRKAAARQIPEGQYWLAYCLRYGIGCFIDVAEAARLFKLSADAKHALAANQFGEMLERGLGVATNIPEAVRYYTLSSDLASPEGMFNLGDMNHHGKHVVQNIHEAVRLYKLAADANLEEAFFALCEIYRNGENPIPQNLGRAAELAKFSADCGHFRGLIQYAELLEKGLGVLQDQAKASELFASAHSREYAVSQNNYGFALETGKGCRKQPKKAARYYRMAAKNGSAVAMKNFGISYENGIGVARNYVKTAKWYRRSADAGNSGGCASYGRLLQLWRGVFQNYATALAYLRKGAESEDRDCYGYLGLMYQNGEGVEQNYEEAAHFYRRASDKGLSWAIVNLGRMYEQGNGVGQDSAAAATLYEKALNLGDEDGAEGLAKLHRDGRGVAKNMAEARRLFKLAIELGSTTAAASLAALD